MAHIHPRETINLAEYDQLNALIRAYVDAHRAHAQSALDLSLDQSQADLIWDRLRATTSELTDYLVSMLEQDQRRQLADRSRRQWEARR